MYLDYSDLKRMLVVAKAIAHEARTSILKFLNEQQSLNKIEIAKQLDFLASNAALIDRILEKSGLLVTMALPEIRGSMKISSKVYKRIILHVLSDNIHKKKENSVEIPMPKEKYMDREIYPPTCGLTSEYSRNLFKQYPDFSSKY